MFELKGLSEDAVATAQKKAVRYRLLNEPRLAESICRDILIVEADRQDALITLILALTDQYEPGGRCSVSEAMDLVPRLKDEFARHYYTGIICERRAMAQLRVHGSGSGPIAYDWFRRAMEQFEKAEALSPPGNDDAVLRWNTCARAINDRSDVRPLPEHRVPDMLE